MLNLLWPIFLIVSIIYAIATGKAEQLNSGIFDEVKDAVDLSITFLGTMCLWNGIMKIVQETSLMNKLVKFIEPFMRFLFPKLKGNKRAYQEISLNMVANIMGLGNAATPLGIKAMTTMQKDNPKKDTLTDSMIMFILINTASLQLIPTNVIAIRMSLGSENSAGIIVPVWIATVAAAFAGIMATKFAIHKWGEGKDRKW